MLSEIGLEQNPSTNYLSKTNLSGNNESTPSSYTDISAHVVQNFSQLKKAFSLVNTQYIREGYAEPNNSGLRYSIHNLLPVTTTFVATVNNSIVGTLSAIVDSPIGLPCSGDFSNELEALRSQGHKIAECTMFACKRDENLPTMELHLELTRQIFKWCIANNIRYLCHVVNPKHVTFWKKQFGFKVLTEARTCSHVCKNPGVFMTLNLAELHSGTTRLAPLAKKLFVSCLSGKTTCPIHNYQLNKDEICYLITKESNILAKATKAQLITLDEHLKKL